MGASLGREAAPQLAGGAFASRLCERARVPPWQRRLLVACGAGAGMAAVYNVPLGGALFAVEVLLGTLALPFVLPALATSVIATAVSWTMLANVPTYRVPIYGASGSQIVWAAIAGPLAGLAAAVWVRMVGARRTTPVHSVGGADDRSCRGVRRARAPLRSPIRSCSATARTRSSWAVTAQLGVGLIAVLVVLKPLATAGCLGSGAPEGSSRPRSPTACSSAACSATPGHRSGQGRRTAPMR